MLGGEIRVEGLGLRVEGEETKSGADFVGDFEGLEFIV